MTVTGAGVSAKRKFDLVEASVEVEPVNVPTGFDLLPDEVLFDIIWRSMVNIRSLVPLSKVCSRWRLLLKDKEIYREIIKQIFPHLMTENYEKGSYFAKAFSFANKLKKIASEFTESQRNLLTYNRYKNKINEAFSSSESMMSSLPYFDLRPIAWLEPIDWIKQFNQICPLLKNVRALNVNGIGNTICFDQLKMPPLPVAGHVIGFGKEVMKELGGFFGGINPDKKNTELANLLTFCVCAIGKSSQKLETLFANDTNIFKENLVQILNISTIKRLDVAHCKNFYRQRDVDEISRKFPKVKIEFFVKESPQIDTNSLMDKPL